MAIIMKFFIWIDKGGHMRERGLNRNLLFVIVVVAFILGIASPTQAADKVGKEKKFTLEWLNQPQVVEKFGKISDAMLNVLRLMMTIFISIETHNPWNPTIYIV